MWGARATPLSSPAERLEAGLGSSQEPSLVERQEEPPTPWLLLSRFSHVRLCVTP